jgi:hypothetical protein
MVFVVKKNQIPYIFLYFSMQREKDYWVIMKFRNILKMIFSGIQERKGGLHIGTCNVFIYLFTCNVQMPS